MLYHALLLIELTLRHKFRLVCVRLFCSVLDSLRDSCLLKSVLKITPFVVIWTDPLTNFSHGMRWRCSFHFRNVTNKILFSLLCVQCIFFWFYQSVGFKGNIKYAEKGIMSAMECANVASFTFATWQIRSCLLCKFISPEATVISLFAILRVFHVGLGNWSEFNRSNCNFPRSIFRILRQEKWIVVLCWKLNICKPCKDARITSLVGKYSTSFPGSLLLPLPGAARRDPGTSWSRATLTIENIKEGSSVIRQLVALSFVEFKVSRCAATDITRDVFKTVLLKQYLVNSRFRLLNF